MVLCEAEDGNMAPLTSSQREEFRQMLLTLQTELKAMVEGRSSGTRPVAPDSAIGRISRMDAIQIQQMAQANMRKAKQRLEQIEAALNRLKGDDFGECAEGGDDIGYPRLRARPEAPFCVLCQNRREQGN